MQTLGVSQTPAQSENRLKSLFWPSIHSTDDVDYLGMQGYWVCSVVSAFALVTALITGHPISGLLVLLFYYFGGVGVREHSRWAASCVFIFFALDTIVAPGALKIILLGLLLANVRATWLASSWTPQASDSTMPVRLNETWTDKFADQLPIWLWPKVRLVYYTFSTVILLLSIVGAARMLARIFA
ncbi:MAG: hypothetical protein ACRD4X_09680 [Candidatus Acidiferrales bacterium]